MYATTWVTAVRFDICLAVALEGWVAGAHARDVVEVEPDRPDTVVTALVLGKHTVELSGAVTLQNVQSVLGKARIELARHHGEADKVCYRARATGETVTLESDEMGGPIRQVLGFHVYSPSAAPAGPVCTVTDSFAHAQTDNGIRAGMTRADVAARMGTPEVTSTPVEVKYSYDEPILGRPDAMGVRTEIGERLATLSIYFHDARVVQIAGWRNDVY